MTGPDGKLRDIIEEKISDTIEAYGLSDTSTREWNTKVYRISKIVKKILAYNPSSVIDIGCGTGALIRTLAELDIMCCGVDAVEKHIDFNRRVCPDAEFIKADITRALPTDRKFDLMVSSEVIEHIDKPMMIFELTRKLLNENGHFVLTTPNSESIAQCILKIMPKGLRDRKLKGSEHLHPLYCTTRLTHYGVHRWEGFSKKQLIKYGRKTGLKQIYYDTFSLPFPNSGFWDRFPEELLKAIINNHDKMVCLNDILIVFKKPPEAGKEKARCNKGPSLA